MRAGYRRQFRSPYKNELGTMAGVRLNGEDAGRWLRSTGWAPDLCVAKPERSRVDGPELQLANRTHPHHASANMNKYGD